MRSWNAWLGQDSTDSGTPPSKESIAARERRKAGRRQRQESERERRQDRKRGGQPGHQGNGLARDPDPGEVKEAGPPAECRSCRARLDGAAAAGSRWAQVIDVEVIRTVTEWALPGLACPCCGTVTFAEPPPGAHAGSVSCGAVLNAAAVVLTAYGNVPHERAAQVMAMLLGVPVSPGWMDKASARLAAQLGKAGFDEAMLAALAGQDALAADETPVNVPGKNAPQPAAREEGGEQDPEDKEKAAAGAPHVLIVRTPDGRLTWLQALASRRKGDVAAGIPAAFTGLLMTDGYTGYQHLLSRLRRGISSNAASTSSGDAGQSSSSAPEACSPGQATSSPSCARRTRPSRTPAPAAAPPSARTCWTSSRERYDDAAAVGITHNRLRDWHEGNHPGYALGCWLREYKEQVFLFTRDFAVDWTTNVAERGAKAAKRHQAVSGYWHTLATLARWCRIRSYLDSAAAHGITALDAIRAAIEGKPWLPPLPALN